MPGFKSIETARTMPRALYSMLGALGLAASLLVPAAHAQDTVGRVRGTIERVENGAYIVKSREGDVLKLKLAAGAGVSGIAPAALADIKQGTYIGVTGMPLRDGSQKAIEVHIFPEAMRGAGEGHRPWDLQPDSTMTNANVEATVAATDGRVLTLKYKGGEQKIILPDGVPVVTFTPGDASDLKPGAQIFVAGAKQLPDGTLEASRVSVGKGIAPPM